MTLFKSRTAVQNTMYLPRLVIVWFVFAPVLLITLTLAWAISKGVTLEARKITTADLQYAVRGIWDDLLVPTITNEWD